MNAPRDQPSKVSTEEEVRPADEHVVTSDLPDDVVAASPAKPEAKPAASPPGDQTPAAPAAAEPSDKPRVRDRSAERRIGRLTKQVATLSDGRAVDQQQIETLTGQVNDLKKATAAATPEPQLVDFKTPQEFAKAYGKWETAQAAPAPTPGADSTAPATPARSPATPAPPARQPAAEIDPEVKSFQSRGQEKLGEEFIEALNIEGTAVDVDMGEFLMDSDYGPEIYVHLANNQDEAKTIYDSGATRKVTALQALEAKAKAGELDIDGMVVTPPPDGGEPDNKPKETPKSAAGSKETKAKTVPEDTGQPGSATVLIDPENESMDDYAARRGKEEARKQGRIP